MHDSKGLSYFFLGLGIGVAVGMVFAPQAGDETRGLLRSKASEGGDYLKHQAEGLKDQAKNQAEGLKHQAEGLRTSAQDLMEKGKGAVARQKDQLSAAVEAGKQAYRETVSPAAEPSRLVVPDAIS